MSTEPSPTPREYAPQEPQVLSRAQMELAALLSRANAARGSISASPRCEIAALMEIMLASMYLGRDGVPPSTEAKC
jgi:hypothetical protein